MKRKLERFRELNDEIRGCRKCRLWKTRKNALPGEGDISSDLMLIAQAPGETENEQGKMFVGPSGGVLDELLSKSGIGRDGLFMTNLLKCMLPGYRRPRHDEIEACSSFLDKEIQLVDPALLCPLGYYSTRYLFEKYEIRNKLEFPEICGDILSLSDRKILPLGHPAAILYDESIKDEMVEHYKVLGDKKP
ncbi:MAG: uracil-DNA glycosylase [Candidatus Hadarchaeia archaeon]